MADINLLPENLRDKADKARAGANENDSPKFYNPKDSAKKPAEGSPPGRWQQLMSALTKNINAAKSQSEPKITSAIPTPNKAPAEPIKSAIPEVMPSELNIPKATPEPVIQKPITDKPKLAIPPIPAQVSSKASRAGGSLTKHSSTLDVNLLPAQEGRKNRRSLMAALATTAVVGVVAFGFAYFGLRLYLSQQESKMAKIQDEITLLQTQLETARTQTELAISTQHRLSLLTKVLSTQGNWTPFFSWLETSTTKFVQINNIAIDANGTITLAGTTNDLTEVGRQLLAYQQNQNVLEVTLTSVGLQSENVRLGLVRTTANFTFAIKVKPDLFVTSAQ